LVRPAYDGLKSRGSDLVDPATHPSLEKAVDILDAWYALLQDVGRIYPVVEGRHYGRSYSPSLGQPGMSIFFQWWYAFKRNLFGGGVHADERYVGAVNFADGSLGAGEFLGETTYNMVSHILSGPGGAVPQEFEGDYFAGQRDEIVIESLNDALELLSGSDPLPELSYGACDGTQLAVHGFGTPDPDRFAWSPPESLDFDCLDSFADPLLATGTLPTSFGKAAEQNRSTYMQVVEASQPLRAANVLAPGQSGFIRHGADGMGTADVHMGDQAGLFRNFEYKPMNLFYPTPY
jgi:hypothetical protein